jgi:hypothetical protein
MKDSVEVCAQSSVAKITKVVSAPKISMAIICGWACECAVSAVRVCRCSKHKERLMRMCSSHERTCGT